MTSSDTALPADYADLLEALKTRVANARNQAQTTVNAPNRTGRVAPNGPRSGIDVSRAPAREHKCNYCAPGQGRSEAG
jgi:hypothetical protein